MNGTMTIVLQQKKDFIKSEEFLKYSIYITKVMYSEINLGNTLKLFKLLEIDIHSYFSLNIILESLYKYNNIEISLDLKERIEHFISSYKYVQALSQEEKELLFYETLSLRKKDKVILALLKDMLNEKETNFETTFNFLFSNSIDSKIETMHNEALLILDRNKEENITGVLDNKYEIELAKSFNIERLKNLQYSDSEDIKLIYLHKLDELEEMILQYSFEDSIQIIKEGNEDKTFDYVPEDENILLSNILGKISERSLEILFKREGINCGEDTLESIGKEYLLTRERVRQIVAKIKQNIKDRRNDFIYEIEQVLCTIFRQAYIHLDELVDATNNKTLANLIKIIIADNNSKHFKFNEKFKLIYIDCVLEDAIEDELSKYDYVISEKIFNSTSQFGRKLIDNFYKKTDDNIYLKVGYSHVDVYCYIIDKILPNGFKDCDEHLRKIYDYIDDNFPDMKYPTGHSLSAVLDRKGYTLINKGTYINSNKVCKIPDKLVDEIIDFILKSETTIWYSSIFALYKDRLSMYGISNRYYLKGVLDPLLPDFVITKRDYLCSSEEFLSSGENIKRILREHKGVIILEELKKMFPGVKDYVLNKYIAEEKMILLSFGKVFISESQLNLTDDFLPIVRKELHSLFDLLESKVLSTRKLYARMKIKHSRLMERNKVVSNQYALFSILQYYLKDDYYFRRPYISLDETKLDAETILDSYLATLSKFNTKIITRYANSIGLRMISSYLEFFIDKSEEFVQINIDTAVRKSLLQLEENTLVNIKSKIDYLIRSFDEINTSNFVGYNFLPKINYQWNKYLLVGIIRSFFNDDYTIKYTNSQYVLTDFIIREVKI